MTARICLLSGAPIWVNPRLTKEADTLFAAGYDVVTGYRADGDLARDNAVLARCSWRWHRIDAARSRQPMRWARAAVRQHAAAALWRLGWRHDALARAAYCRADNALLSWAIAQRADLYIAHTQPVLAVTAMAARTNGVPFAFDCEDLLAEEAADGGRAPWRRELVIHLEGRMLPRAAYVSATSEPMADYLRSTYRLDRVEVWHNCWRALESAHVRPSEHAPPAPTDLAWISATIGPKRGLEDMFAALPALGGRVRLHLYGVVPPESAGWLQSHIVRLGPDRAPVVHPPVPAERIIETLARHDVGLSLDGNDCLNRSLTVSNKVFYYLHAGLACVTTDTPGHRSIVTDESRFGTRYRAGDVAGLVAAVERYLAPGELTAARRAAWETGQRTYAWERESPRLLTAVDGALAVSAQAGKGRRLAIAGG